MTGIDAVVQHVEYGVAAQPAALALPPALAVSAMAECGPEQIRGGRLHGQASLSGAHSSQPSVSQHALVACPCSPVRHQTGGENSATLRVVGPRGDG